MAQADPNGLTYFRGGIALRAARSLASPQGVAYFRAKGFGPAVASGGAVQGANGVGAIASAETVPTPALGATYAITGAGAIGSAVAFGTVADPGRLAYFRARAAPRAGRPRAPVDDRSVSYFRNGAMPAALGSPRLGIALSAGTASIADVGAVATAGAFGAARLDSVIVLAGVGAIASGETFGGGSLRSELAIGPTGIASAEAFGSAADAGAFAYFRNRRAAAFARASAIPNWLGYFRERQAPRGLAIVGPGSVPVTLTDVVAVATVSIDTLEAFGVGVMTQSQGVTGAGAIGSAEVFGTPLAQEGGPRRAVVTATVTLVPSMAAGVLAGDRVEAEVTA